MEQAELNTASDWYNAVSHSLRPQLQQFVFLATRDWHAYELEEVVVV